MIRMTISGYGLDQMNSDMFTSKSRMHLNKPLLDKGKDMGNRGGIRARALVAIAILIISYMSFAENAFGVVSNEWFRIHQVDSEQLVLDGILYKSRAESSELFSLGNFSRPGTMEQHFKHSILYNENNTDGDFVPYNSQFGLQVKVFSQAKKFGLSFDNMQNMTAGLLALLCSLSYLLLRDLNFPGLASLVFAGSFAFSPWVVVFARNLYWVPFTWYLPIITGAWICAGHFKSNAEKVLLLAIGLYLTFSLKMLCGYEYITTIFASTLVCSLLSAYRRQDKLVDLGRLALVVTISFIIAFGSTLGIHIDQINRRGDDGINTILLVASRRSTSSDPETMFTKLCSDKSDPSGCVQKNAVFSKSLQSNPIEVIGRYLAVKDSLPWSYFFRSSSIANEIKELKASGGSIDIMSILSKYGFQAILEFIANLFFQLLNSVLLIGLGLCCIVYSRNRLKSAAIICLLAVAPLSWFVLAKGHSAVHYSMNYVLWYVVLMPSMALLLASNYIGKASLKPK